MSKLGSPFLGTLNIRCRIILRTQKGTIIFRFRVSGRLGVYFLYWMGLRTPKANSIEHSPESALNEKPKLRNLNLQPLNPKSLKPSILTRSDTKPPNPRKPPSDSQPGLHHGSPATLPKRRRSRAQSPVGEGTYFGKGLI